MERADIEVCESATGLWADADTDERDLSVFASGTVILSVRSGGVTTTLQGKRWDVMRRAEDLRSVIHFPTTEDLEYDINQCREVLEAAGAAVAS